jgi:hypothetical protein
LSSCAKSIPRARRKLPSHSLTYLCWAECYTNDTKRYQFYKDSTATRWRGSIARFFSHSTTFTQHHITSQLTSPHHTTYHTHHTTTTPHPPYTPHPTDPPHRPPRPPYTTPTQYQQYVPTTQNTTQTITFLHSHFLVKRKIPSVLVLNLQARKNSQMPRSLCVLLLIIVSRKFQ